MLVNNVNEWPRAPIMSMPSVVATDGIEDPYDLVNMSPLKCFTTSTANDIAFTWRRSSGAQARQLTFSAWPTRSPTVFAFPLHCCLNHDTAPLQQPRFVYTASESLVLYYTNTTAKSTCLHQTTIARWRLTIRSA